MENEIERLVTEWYGGYIPSMEFSPAAYGQFASKVFSMIVSSSKTSEFYFRVNNFPTAAFDPATKTISLPAWYFSAERLTKMFGCENPTAYSITLINGSALHEGLHLKFSSFSAENVIRALAAKFKIPVEMASAIVNIVEDLAIETANTQNRDWIANKNTILFPIATVENEVAKFNGSATSTLRLLVSTKNANVRDLILGVVDARIVKILQELFKTKHYSDYVNQLLRERLAAIIAEMLNEGTRKAEKESKADDGEKNEEESESNDSDNGEDGDENSEFDDDQNDGGEDSESDDSNDGNGESEGEDGDNDSDEDNSAGEDEGESESEESSNDDAGEDESAPSNRIPGEGEAMDDDAAEIANERSDDDAEAIAAEFLKAADKERREVSESKTINSLMTRTIPTIIFKQGTWEGRDCRDSDSETIVCGSRLIVRGSNGFAIKLKQMMTKIKTHGIAKSSGGRLNKTGLHRIATDGKVFNSRSSEEKGRGDEVEITILVDASGSMTGTIGDNAENMFSNIGSREVTIFAGAMAVAKKLTIALVNAGIGCRTIAHTTSMNGYTMQLYVINDSTDPSRRSSIEGNFAEGDRLVPMLAHNFDGYALREVTVGKLSRMGKTSAKQIVIVLSDGQPYTPNYFGPSAIQHTAAACQNARKNGIRVYAINLTTPALHGNAPIYGKEFNLDGTSDFNTVAEDLVERLIRATE